MAIIWADFPSGSLGLYGSTTARMRDGIWAETGEGNASTLTAIVNDPDPNVGSAGRVFRVGTSQFPQTNNRFVFPAGAVATFGAGFRIYMASLPSNDTGTPYVNLRDNSNNFILAIRFRPDGSISAHSGAFTGTEFGRSGPAVTAAAWNHIEFKAFRDAAAGTIEVRVNGVTVLNLNALALGAVDFAMIGFCVGGATGVPGTQAHYKDMVFWDSTGSQNNDFLGSVSVYRLEPDADDTLTWTPSTGSTGFDLVNEAPPDDADYISAADPPPAPNVFGVSNLPPDIVSVRGLLPIIRARKIDGGDGNVQMGLTGTLTDLGADRPMTTAFTYWWDVSELSPDTASPWTPVEVDAVKFQIDRTV